MGRNFMEVPSEIRDLLDMKKPGGKSRRRILGYLVNKRKATLYAIAKDVFGDVGNCYRTAKYHKDKLKEHNLIRESTVSKKIFLSLSTQGESVCRLLGISGMASDRSEHLLDAISALAEEPLDNEVLSKGRSLMTETILDVIQKFSSSPSSRRINPISFYVVIRSYIEERDGFVAPKIAIPKRKLPKAGHFMVSEAFSYAMSESMRGLDEEHHDIKRLNLYRYVRENGLEHDFNELGIWFNSLQGKIPIFTMLSKEMPVLLTGHTVLSILGRLS